jgi:predicted transposase/invertase (TIGR01784 family)
MKKDVRKEQLEEGEIIPINFDYVFEAIFTKEENIDILENFLACYFNIDVNKLKGKVKILPRDLELESKKNKNKQIDLLLELDNEYINIELNNYGSDGIINRNIVYACSVHAKSLGYGIRDYTKIKKTIQINLNTKHKNKDLCEKYFFKNERGEVLSETIEIDNLDMVLGREICYNDYSNKLARWCMVLTSKTEEEFKKYLGDDLMEKEAKSKLVDEVNKYSEDYNTVALYFERSKEELEKNTLLVEAEQKGHDKGVMEGINQRNIDIAKNMLKKSISIEDIIEITGLTKEEIEKL